MSEQTLEQQLEEARRDSRGLVTLLRSVVNDETWATLSMSAAGKEWDSILSENAALRRALLHRAGDDLCWITDGAKIPPKEEFLESCRRYHTQIAESRGVLEDAKTISQLESESLELAIALRESVKLQSHYAKLLNMHDGGERISFNTPKEWMERLRSIRLL